MSEPVSLALYAPEKPKVGRPTDYTRDMCDVVIECGRMGGSVNEMAVQCGVSQNALYEWAKIYPEFNEAFKCGKRLSQSWWERAGQNGMFMPAFSAGAWSRSMAARFPQDWREVKGLEHSGPNGKPIDTRDVSSLSQDEVAELYRQELKS
ncbi:MAG: hypothetical protein ACRCVX_16820 [Shewanella sp.]